MMGRVYRRGLLKVAGGTTLGVGIGHQTREARAASTESVTIDRTIGERVILPPDVDATVTGDANQPGIELTVGLRSTDDTQFVRGSTTSVASDGTWTASFDLSGASEGTEFTITVSSNGETQASAPGVIDTLSAEIYFDDRTEVKTDTLVGVVDASDGAVEIPRAELSHGGFVVIHQGGPGGDVIGTSEYLEPGETHTNIAIGMDPATDENEELYAMPHLDSNQNQQFDFQGRDEPYPESEPTVIDVVLGPSPTDTTRQPATATPTRVPTPTRTSTDDAVPVDVTTPGFGLLAALVAVAGAARVWVDRRC